MRKKTETIAFGDFMSGAYKTKTHKKKDNSLKMAVSSMIPLSLVATPVFASTPEAVPATAKEWMGEQTMSALAHVLDPVVDVLVALSFPVASVIIVGACFLFMLGNSEKAWTTIQNAGLGYVLIQVSPLILNVLKQVGNAV
jgi:hypothetical protein